MGSQMPENADEFKVAGGLIGKGTSVPNPFFDWFRYALKHRGKPGTGQPSMAIKRPLPDSVT
jgi:hypothetical protein